MEKVRHVKIHSLQSKVTPAWNARPENDHMIAKVTCFGRDSMPLIGFEECLIALNDIVSYIHQNKNKKDRYIFTSIAEESIGSLYMVRNATTSTS